MSQLRVTLMDVGWGDSILVESEDGNRHASYGLVDSNDTSRNRSSYIFLKRFFDRKKPDWEKQKPNFDFVMLSHDHADHGQGLKEIMTDFGTTQYWYSKSNSQNVLSDLIRFASRSSNVKHHQSVDRTKVLPNLGEVEMRVLWPPREGDPSTEENNNSIVLSLTLGGVTFLLTGDAEGDVWQEIAEEIPDETRVFKLPHHGSENGTFINGNQAPWMDRADALPTKPLLGISCHLRPFPHPSQSVVDEICRRNYSCCRTDQHYHVTFATDGRDVTVKYSHESDRGP